MRESSRGFESEPRQMSQARTEAQRCPAGRFSRHEPAVRTGLPRTFTCVYEGLRLLVFRCLFDAADISAANGEGRSEEGGAVRSGRLADREDRSRS